jgi:thiamine-monophosphate kinase
MPRRASHAESTVLRDLGERRIVDELLGPRYGSGGLGRFGDDVATMVNPESAPSTVVATTDPCPEPLASQINEPSSYYFGWLLAAINLSDIAAAGARPTGLLISLELPGQMSVHEFGRLLDGVDDCCAASGTAVRGGNLRESETRRATGFATGVCTESPPLSRRGARPDDLVAVIGSLGLAWAAYFSYGSPRQILSGPDLASARAALLTPSPLVGIGRRLREGDAVTACTDASDGLLPAVVALGRASNCGAELELDGVPYPRPLSVVSDALGIHPFALARGWGDWQLVCAVPERNRTVVEDLAAAEHTSVAFIGRYTENPEFRARVRGRSGRLTIIDSERFAGPEGAPLVEWYPEALRRSPILEAGR